MDYLEALPNGIDFPFRYNIFTQEIERDGKTCQGESALDRYHIYWARRGWKISKDLAFDCAVQAARQNEYDPVKEYILNCHKKGEPE